MRVGRYNLRSGNVCRSPSSVVVGEDADPAVGPACGVSELIGGHLGALVDLALTGYKRHRSTTERLSSDQCMKYVYNTVWAICGVHVWVVSLHAFSAMPPLLSVGQFLVPETALMIRTWTRRTK